MRETRWRPGSGVLTRRGFLQITGAGAATLLLRDLSWAAPLDRKKLNVLFIASDDLNW